MCFIESSNGESKRACEILLNHLTCYLQYHNAHAHQTWPGSELS